MKRILNKIRSRIQLGKIKVISTQPSLGRFIKFETFALNELDRQVEKYLPGRNLTFVELGANDGISQSNTLFFEIYKGWRGVLIEPSPPNFHSLVKNRSRANSFFNCACVGFDYKEQSVDLIFSNLMTIPLIENSDVVNPLEHARQGEIYWGGTSYLFSAPAKTLNSILHQSCIESRIDFLSLDVEGGELSVLQGLDHDTFRFNYILVESRDFSRIRDFLESQRYEFIQKFSEHDYFFKDISW
jgi:FkbM family methyltransferase